MRPSTIIGVTLLAAAAGAALALTLGRQSIPAPPAGAALALTLGEQGVPAAPGSASPCAPATSPPVAQAPRSPAAPPAQAAVHPVTRPHTIPAPAAAAPRPENRATLYASGEHLRYSWRTSVVRWLGGAPASTTADRQAAVREGWWGEVEPPLAGRVASSR